MFVSPLQRLGCDNLLDSSQQEDPCLQCGGSGQSCYRVQNSFSVRNLQTGAPHIFHSNHRTGRQFRNFVSLISKATTRCSSSRLEPPPSASEKESPHATTSVSSVTSNSKLCSDTDWNFYARPAIKNLRGEYYLNGHWVIEFSRATSIAGTTLYYQRGAEGDNVPESITGRGPTTEPLVVEVRLNMLYLTKKEKFPARGVLFSLFSNQKKLQEFVILSCNTFVQQVALNSWK